MPYEVRPNGDAFEVVNSETGTVKAKHTSKEQADKQVRLLNAIEHGYDQDDQGAQGGQPPAPESK